MRHRRLGPFRRLQLARPAVAGADRRFGARPALRRDAEDAAHLEEVALERVDEPLGLAVLAGDAEADALVLDDVADAEAVGRRRAEAEVAERRVPAVRRREDRVVELVPARVGEQVRERDAAVARRGAVASDPTVTGAGGRGGGSLML